jgi:hypothetical protein
LTSLAPFFQFHGCFDCYGLGLDYLPYCIEMKKRNVCRYKKNKKIKKLTIIWERRKVHKHKAECIER